MKKVRQIVVSCGFLDVVCTWICDFNLWNWRLFSCVRLIAWCVLYVKREHLAGLQLVGCRQNFYCTFSLLPPIPGHHGVMKDCYNFPAHLGCVVGQYSDWADYCHWSTADQMSAGQLERNSYKIKYMPLYKRDEELFLQRCLRSNPKGCWRWTP
jgi:hypothetical protein